MLRRRLLTISVAAALATAASLTFAEEKTMPRILIAYYSRRGENYWPGGTRNLSIGNTERLANKIQAITGGDLYEIDTVKTYPTGYREATRVAEEELTRGDRPALKSALPDFSAYDIVFIGHPVWWGRLPPALNTFLDSAAIALNGKTIFQFCTHEGSGFAQTTAELKVALPQTTFGTPFSVYGHEVDDASADVRRWLQKPGLVK